LGTVGYSFDYGGDLLSPVIFFLGGGVFYLFRGRQPPAAPLDSLLSDCLSVKLDPVVGGPFS
jgi:hypothetical protein